MPKIWKHFLDRKFGCRKGTILICGGLVAAASEEIFDTTLRSLKAKWNLLGKDNISANASGFSFYEWFKFYKVSDCFYYPDTVYQSN